MYYALALAAYAPPTFASVNRVFMMNYMRYDSES